MQTCKQSILFWASSGCSHSHFLGLSEVLQYVQTAVDIYTPPTAPLGYPNKQYPSTTVRVCGLQLLSPTSNRACGLKSLLPQLAFILLCSVLQLCLKVKPMLCKWRSIVVLATALVKASATLTVVLTDSTVTVASFASTLSCTQSHRTWTCF
eukprot:4256413-Amphidinium_carterae.1